MPKANSMPVPSNLVYQFSGHTPGARQIPTLLDSLHENLRSRLLISKIQRNERKLE